MDRAGSPRVVHADNGLRLLHIHRPDARAAIFGLCVRAGSRNETEANAGLAHFVEHTIFKGTAKRSSWHIINRMEAVGGELNAYTTKDETVVYSIFPSGNETRAIELITDLAANSRFPDRELEKEREVVIDEINSYLDSPAEAVYDLFEENFFAGTPLAHNILGTENSVRELSSTDCRHFLDTYYTIDNMVAFYSGPQRPETIVRQLGRYSDMLPPTAARPGFKSASGRTTGSTFAHEAACHQTHAVVGASVPPPESSDRHTVALLANILGGPGMNSLLNVSLREKRGLVYSVEASAAMFAGTGALEIYFGCDPSDTNRCLNLVSRTLARIADGLEITPARLARAKKQYLGQMAVAAENSENCVLAYARELLFRDVITCSAQTREAVDAINAADIARIAEAFRSPTIQLIIPSKR